MERAPFKPQAIFLLFEIYFQGENTWLLPQGGESIFFRKEISVLSIKTF